MPRAHIAGLAQTGPICDYLLGMPDEVNSGGEFPKDPGLEARVSAVEAALAEIRAEFKAIHVELARFARLEAGMDQLRQDVAEIKGRLTNIPTSFQLVFMLAAFTVATFVGATGLSLAVLRLAGAH